MRKVTDTPRKYHWICVIAICLTCITTYSNTLNSPFVFDDIPNIKENTFIRLTDLDIQKLYDAGFRSVASNRPVANVSFALNYYYGGYDVKGYHIVNIAVHLINGILIYLLALNIFRQMSRMPCEEKERIRITSIPLISLFAALIFVTHPIQTQSVTYMVQRMNSMAVMFYLLAMLLYIRGRLSQITWRR